MFTSTSTIRSMKPIDIFELDVPKNDYISVSSNITGESGSRLDAHTWLPLCAPIYEISANLNDYIIVPVVTVISDIPNTNGDCIELAEMMAFNAEHGMPFYKTFKGKPVQLEHDNKILNRARGVILDSYISPLSGFKGKRGKIVQLLAIDKTKDRESARKVMSGDINTYSIGARFTEYQCSVSGKIYRPGMPAGQYTQPGVPTYMRDDGQLVFRKLKGLYGFETSIVATPAYTCAVSDDLIDMGGSLFTFTV